MEVKYSMKENHVSRRMFCKAGAAAGLAFWAGRALADDQTYPVHYPIPALDSSYIYYCPELREITAPGKLIHPDGTAFCSWSRRPYLELNFEDARFYSAPYFQRFRMKKWDMYHLITPSHYLSFLISWIGYAAFASGLVYDRASKKVFEGFSLLPPRPELKMMRDSTTGLTQFKSGSAQMSFEVIGERRRIKIAWPKFAGEGLDADIMLELPASAEMICATHLTNPRRMHYDVKIACMTAQGELKLAGKNFSLEPENSFGMLDFSRGFPPNKIFWYWAVSSGRDEQGKPIGFNLGHGNSPAQTNENAIFYDGRVHKIGQTRCQVPQENLMSEWRIWSEDGRIELKFSPENVRYSNLKIGSLHSIGNPALGTYSGAVRLDDGRTIAIRDLFGLYEWFDQKW